MNGEGNLSTNSQSVHFVLLRKLQYVKAFFYFLLFAFVVATFSNYKVVNKTRLQK